MIIKKGRDRTMAYDMTMSDLMMKIGSQLWIVIMLILVLWSGEEGSFPANQVRNLLTGTATVSK
jgi:hypothetical protein